MGVTIMIKKLLGLLCSFILLIFSLFSYFDLTKVKAMNVERFSFNENIDDDSTTNIENTIEQYNNSDIVGNITILNTTFTSSVVKHTDNTYYLSHNLYKKYDKGGAIYLDYRVDLDNSRKILIYGHNSRKINRPFSILENYYDEDYYNQHKYIEIESLNNSYIYEIFSVYIETSDWTYYNLINFSNDEYYLNHILELKNKSFYDTKVDATSSDRILILQTCSNNKKYEKYKNKYLLVVAKLIDNN